MSEQCREVIIDELRYKKETNLFLMKVRDLETDKVITFAINGLDWGVTPQNVKDDIINKFIKNMEGQKRNLFLEVDKTTVSHSREQKGKSLEETELTNINKNMDDYPIDQIMNTLYLEEDEDNSM